MVGSVDEDVIVGNKPLSGLLRYDDKGLEGVKRFKYKPLITKRKTIRLLRLTPGVHQNPHIECELFDVEFNSKHEAREMVESIPPFDESSNDDDSTDDEDSVAEDDAVSDSDTDESDIEAQSASKKTKPKPIPYEALSWCWGTADQDYALSIRRKGRAYRRQVTKELALALKYLRHTSKDRVLWIDALCINQEDHEERNHQVQMMSLIYTRAKNVCIWLGEDTPESTLAINFIKNDIMKLEKFDDVCSKEENSEKWQALLTLMQRPWFSRRWVVQEIALARNASVHCGPDSIPWKDFAVAVELFVEVETATHRLSEVMQKDPRFFHVPGWFEYVSELGASLLVSAAGKIFRQDKLPNKSSMKDLISRRGLLSLEYLVSTLFIFESSEPRDAVYSLLAIARDTAPFAEVSSINNDKESLLMSTFSAFMERKPYIVDYARPYVDVCKDFLSFCIQRTYKSDPARALDVLCRPWAQVPLAPKLVRAPTENNKAPSTSTSETKLVEEKSFRIYLPRWRQILLDSDSRSAEYENAKAVREREFVNKQYWNLKCMAFLGTDEQGGKKMKPCISGGNEHSIKEHPIPSELQRYFPTKPRPAKESTSRKTAGRRTTTKVPDKSREDMQMPSWVSRIDGAPYALFSHPGMHDMRMGRKNADPLVGLPLDGHRNYAAAQTKAVDMATLKFRKRPMMNHYSLYVKGFILGEVSETTPSSQGGAIPQAWTTLGGWSDAMTNNKSEPPPDFWRTLVADRGKDNRNPPYYYEKACRESVSKGGLRSGSVNTTALINNERNSIIAEFCRRVQAVIWNRSLIKMTITEETAAGEKKIETALGLASSEVQPGDQVCIIYGCTVPVILRRERKSEDAQDKEKFEDRVEIFKQVFRDCQGACARKVKYSLRSKKRKEAEEIRTLTAKLNTRIELWIKDRVETEKKRKAEFASLIPDKRPKHDRPSSAAEEHGGGTVSGSSQQQDWTGSNGPRAESPARMTDAEGITPLQDKNTRQRLARPQQANPKQTKQQVQEEDESHYYVLLGESYIHGMMDGEAITKQFSRGLPEHVFELR